MNPSVQSGFQITSTSNPELNSMMAFIHTLCFTPAPESDWTGIQILNNSFSSQIPIESLYPNGLSIKFEREENPSQTIKLNQKIQSQC